MKYFRVPNPIHARDPRTGEPMLEMQGEPPRPTPIVKSLRDVAFELWLNDGRAVEGGRKAIKRWDKVCDAFDGAEPGEVIALEDQDWEMLRKIIEAPKVMYGALLMRQMLPFIDAVLDARNEPPSIDVAAEAS